MVKNIITIVITVVVGIIGWLYVKYSGRQEEDMKNLSDRHQKIYEMLINTQEKNTESSNRLATAVDKLAVTVTNLENQSAERHASLTARINDNHEAIELIRARMHWVVNKMTILKFAAEANGAKMTGDWEAP